MQLSIEERSRHLEFVIGGFGNTVHCAAVGFNPLEEIRVRNRVNHNFEVPLKSRWRNTWSSELNLARPQAPCNTVAQVCELLNSYWKMSVRLLVGTLNVLKNIIHRIVTEDLQIRKGCAKLVLKVLINDQKNNRAIVCEELG